MVKLPVIPARAMTARQKTPSPRSVQTKRVSNMISEYICHECGHGLETDESFAGDKYDCPECEGTMHRISCTVHCEQCGEEVDITDGGVGVCDECGCEHTNRDDGSLFDCVGWG